MSILCTMQGKKIVGITRDKVKYMGLIIRKKNGARDNRSKIQGINRKREKKRNGIRDNKD